MLAAALQTPIAFAPVSAPAVSNARASVVMETKAELEALAVACNPIIGYWDPMNLVDYDQFSQGQEASIGFLRQAEIKHGRVAMAAFVGYIVQSNGIYFPWKLTGDISYADIAAAGSPPDQWDALPTAAKVQILSFIGLLELFSETSTILEMSDNKHYMRGGKPGAFPKINTFLPHPIPFELYDPFGFSKNASEEKKAKGLVTEINNGRAAMLGIMGFLAAQKVPGSVPALTFLPSYSGEVMAPFTSNDVSLPYVEEMLKFSIF